MTKPLRILAYTRVSSDAQAADGKSSLADQEQAIKRHAKDKHGSNVVQMYVESESGVHEKFEKREQIQALMREARRGDLVLVDKVDRWSRDPEFTHVSMRQLVRERGVSVYFIADACDPSTDAGDTMLNFRILFAHEEHKRIKLRMVGTRRLLRDRGYYSEGRAPLGYRRPVVKGPEKNVLVVHDEDAALVRRAFQLAIDGRSLSEIGHEIGIDWTRIGKILRSRVYLGEMTNTAGEWMRGKHPPIVDADTFSRAQAAIAGRRHGFRPGADAETSTWVLREVARCASCDSVMSAAYAGPHGPGRRHYYRCHARCTTAYVRVGPVEDAAAPLVLERLEALRALLSKEPAPVKQAPPKTDDRRAKLAHRRERLLEQHADGHLTREALREKIAKLDTDLLSIDGEEQRAHKPSPLADPAVRRSTLKQVATLRKAWRDADPLERRAIVGELATSCRMQAGKGPVFVWRTAEELAAT